MSDESTSEKCALKKEKKKTKNKPCHTLRKTFKTCPTTKRPKIVQWYRMTHSFSRLFSLIHTIDN